MTSVDVDAVNERLNGLVTLLKAVGVDGGHAKSSMGGAPDARQLDDDQIEAIIQKLQLAQTEAPQIIAALEAQARQRKPQYKPPPPPPPEEEEEEDDEFDEDANYPVVGPGCSDDISVVSDLTTPTVIQGVTVPEEEHYRDTLPPMIIGGGPGHAPPMMIAPTKRKNLVGAVRASHNNAPSSSRRNDLHRSVKGGAAANRRKHYNATMEKLAHEPVQPSPPAQKKKLVKKKKPTARRASVDNSGGWASSGGGDGWNAFDGPNPSASTPQTMIDDDGFLMGETSFDPFQQATSPKSFKKPKDPFGHQPNEESKESSKHRRKVKKSSALQNQNSFEGFGSKANSFEGPKPSKAGKARKSRRASLAM